MSSHSEISDVITVNIKIKNTGAYSYKMKIYTCRCVMTWQRLINMCPHRFLIEYNSQCNQMEANITKSNHRVLKSHQGGVNFDL